MIGVFDSGLGGLTVLRAFFRRLPQVDYLYVGDNARAPYGNKSLDLIYDYTRQAVEFLFKSGCVLIILACNTASANALRKIQQEWIPLHYPDRRVLLPNQFVYDDTSIITENVFSRIGRVSVPYLPPIILNIRGNLPTAPLLHFHTSLIILFGI